MQSSLGFWTLSKKFTAAVVVSGVAACLLIGAVAIAAARTSTDQTREKLETQAELIADILDRNLYERYGDVQAFTLNHVLRGDKPEPIVEAMNRYTQLYGVYPLMMYLNAEGQVIAANDQDARGRPIENKFIYQRNYRETSWFRAAFRGDAPPPQQFASADNRAVSGTYFEDARIDQDITSIYGPTAAPAVPFAAPVRIDGKVVGVWVNFFSIELAAEMLKATSAELHKHGLGSARVMLLNGSGQVLLAHPTDAQPTPAMVQAALSGAPGNANDGDRSFGFAHSLGALGFPGMPWSIVVDTELSAIESTYTTLRNAVLLASLVSLLLLAAVGLVLAARFARPIRHLAAVMEEVSGGNLAAVVETQQRDEVGLLADGVRATLERLRSLIVQVRAASEHVATSSTQVSASGRGLADNSTSSAAALEQITGSITLMSTRTSETLKRVEETRRVAQDVQSAAGGGERQMDEMMRAMGEINSTADEVAKVIKVIDDIAFQINLLSLNAAVEAARAGDHGRGFAVVAEEVRALASRSAQAARDSGEIIARAISKATQGTNIAAATSTSLGTIVSSIQRMAGLAEEVTGAMAEQARGIEEASVGVRQVDDVTQRNTASAEELAAAATELAGFAQDLRGHLRFFSTGDAQASDAPFEIIDARPAPPRASADEQGAIPLFPKAGAPKRQAAGFGRY